MIERQLPISQITSFTFVTQPIAIPPDLRPLWKISQILLVLKLCSRKEKATLLKLQLFNWALGSSKALDQLKKYVLRERNYKLRDPNNPYLFIATYCSPRSGSVSRQHLRRLVERATARITGRVCNVRTLKKSSRLLYSEFGGHESFRHLQELGLGKNQARLYAWAKRVKVVPRRASQTTIKTSSIIKQRQPPAGA
jgi:hypothetical protein